MDRINELAAKDKTMGLTDDEKLERNVLREKYLKEFRASFKLILDNTKLKNIDGTLTPLVSKNKKSGN